MTNENEINNANAHPLVTAKPAQMKDATVEGALENFNDEAAAQQNVGEPHGLDSIWLPKTPAENIYNELQDTSPEDTDGQDALSDDTDDQDTP